MNDADHTECAPELGLQFHSDSARRFHPAGLVALAVPARMRAGDVAYGYVEADTLGHAIARETFEKDWQ